MDSHSLQLAQSATSGRRPLRQWPDQIELRSWQRRAFAKWLARSEKDFLAVGTPGSGKTRAALRIAHHALDRGDAVRCVVVCPTEHLRTQWANSAHAVGLSLDPKWSNAHGREISADYHGIVVSYQQVSYAPAIFEKQCEEPTLVIFDEIHHAADQLCWGDAIRQAFMRATERVALSGTPFRSDNCTIPFIRYKQGRSVSDFSYSYSEALSEAVVRPIYFPTINGRARWLSRDGSFVDCWLLDEVPREREAERLRTVLDPGGGWLPSALAAANDKLSEVRETGHPDAGALVLAIDQEHAKAIARLLRTITGADPILAISEDPEASAKIHRFANGQDRFLVCVRLVSEGVDVPRLRVGVLASNVTTELFFRQVVGRFVRMIPGIAEQSAWLYLPAVEPVVGFARHIKEERDHQLAQAKTGLQDVGSALQDGNSLRTRSGIFMPLGSTSQAHDTIFDGSSFSTAELSYADRLRKELAIPLEPPQVAALLRRHASDQGLFVLHQSESVSTKTVKTATLTHTAPAPSDDGTQSPGSRTGRPENTFPPPDDGLPLYARRDELRKRTQKAASKLAGLIGVRPWVLHKQWLEMGGLPQEESTVRDLERKLSFLLERIAEINRKRQIQT